MKANLALFLGVLTATASAQTTHKHYEQSEAATKPAPGGEIAPRLQNLGHAHVQGHDEVEAGPGSS